MPTRKRVCRPAPAYLGCAPDKVAVGDAPDVVFVRGIELVRTPGVPAPLPGFIHPLQVANGINLQPISHTQPEIAGKVASDLPMKYSQASYCAEDLDELLVGKANLERSGEGALDVRERRDARGLVGPR